MTAAFPLHLCLKPSRLLQVWLLSGCTLACLSLLSLPWAVTTQGTLLSLLAVGWFVSARRLWKQCPGLLRVERRDRLLWVQQGVAESAVECVDVLPATLVLPWLIVLAARVGQSHRYLLITPDMTDTESLRAFRAWLRFEALKRRD